MKAVSRLLQLVLLLFALVFIRASFGTEQPSFIRHLFIGTNFFLGILPNSTNWVRVEVSSDLQAWSELINLAASYHVAVYGDESSPPNRFYRIVLPGTDVDQARARWHSQNLTRYHYRFERVYMNPYTYISGSVTVEGDHRTFSDLHLNFEPVAELDAGHLPTIHEIFDLLLEAVVNQSRVTWVRYDPRFGYPVRCVIDHRQSDHPHFLDQIWITDFTPLPE